MRNLHLHYPWKSRLDLNGPYLSYTEQPVSVTGIGTTSGGTQGDTVSFSGIGTVTFNPSGILDPGQVPAIAVIDENDGVPTSIINTDWQNFRAKWPERPFYVLHVSENAGTTGPWVGLTGPSGVQEGFTVIEVNRDTGNAAWQSDWYDQVGLSTLPRGSMVTLWIDSSGSMFESDVAASLQLFEKNCQEGDLTINRKDGEFPGMYGGEAYIYPFIDNLVMPDPVNRGILVYKWYEYFTSGVIALNDGGRISGSGTTTLTVSNIQTPGDDGRQFYLTVDYDPTSATGIGFSTGNAVNEPLTSNIVTLTTRPIIEITTQPSALTTTFQNVTATISIEAGLSDVNFTDDTQYQWQLDGVDVADGVIIKQSSTGTQVNTTVVGSTTKTLSLTSDNPGIGYGARCVILSATASNSPVISDTSIYDVEDTADFNNINIESIPNGLTTATLANFDLDNGEITLNTTRTSTATDYFLHSLYAPDKDVDIEMDLYGGGAPDSSQGQGGYSRIRFTMVQNEEYIIAGLTNEINTPFVYRKAALIACVGEGGKSGVVGKDGGNGGGVGVVGSNGFGNNGGTGAHTVIAGTLPSDGTFGSAYEAPSVYPGDTQAGINNEGLIGGNNGGRTIKCTKGVYWAQQGISACADVAVSGKFRISDGTEIANTASITRGYKAGYNIIQTAGAGTNAFRGGNGVVGGDGGSGNGCGGGGGSGYTDGSVTVVSTQQGGSTVDAKVIIRVAT
jgi:hypothetical protein